MIKFEKQVLISMPIVYNTHNVLNNIYVMSCNVEVCVKYHDKKIPFDMAFQYFFFNFSLFWQLLRKKTTQNVLFSLQYI